MLSGSTNGSQAFVAHPCHKQSDGERNTYT